MAACNIGGTTIHAWSGVGIAADSFDKIFAKISGNAMLKRKWKLTEILVIDEISMLSAELFDMISEIGSRIRGDDRPFGGMQVILCGDFFQLPPIGVTKFCFESKSWSLLLGADGTIVLDKVFRQKDSLFQRLLNNLRRGVVIPEDGALLQHMSSETGAAKTYPTGIKPTLLYATNKGVDEINTSSLNNLEGEEVAYQAIDAPEDSPFMAVLRSGMKAPELLRLKIGAQVMMLKNQDVEQGLVNGARGVVTDFTNARKTSIGMISLPIVTFIVKIGGKEVTKVVEVEPSTWDLQQGNRVVASRVQIPLMLAWAISIHKSQGMTIPYLNVSFRGMFEYGQAYVALSRATDLDGLSISGYSTKSIKAHPLVAKYYDRLGYSTESVHKDEETVVVDIQQLASQFVRDLPAYERKKDEWFTAHNRGAYGPPPSARQPAVNPAKPVYSIFKNVPQVSPVVSSAPVTAKTLPTSSGLPYASTSATISAPAHPASSSSVNFVSDRSSSAISSSLYSFKYNTPSSSSTSAAVSVTPITPVSSSLTEEQKRCFAISTDTSIALTFVSFV